MPPRRYAEDTDVPVARTKADIEQLLARYGADQYATGWDKETGEELVSCRLNGRHLRFSVRRPKLSAFKLTEGGLKRNPSAQQAAADKHYRAQWRRLRLLLLAKFEAIAEEVTSFDAEMAPYVLLPNNTTVADHLAAQVDAVYRTGQMPRGLPGLPPGRDVRLIGEGGDG